MKRFYLLRHEDVHSSSGTGVVAEGLVFDSKMAVMTWLSGFSTVTVFESINTVKALHGHEGRTEIIMEDKDPRFAECQSQIRLNRKLKKRGLKPKVQK